MTSESGRQSEADRDQRLIEEAAREADALQKGRLNRKPPENAIPNYQLLEEIGRGGMGVVYQAIQTTTQRPAAVKIMLAGTFASEEARRRFAREIELAARLQHAGIVRVLGSGFTTTGEQYYAMDLVDGMQLHRWRTESRPDPQTVLRLFVELCRAVEHAHAQGIIHRDLKPANVLVDRDGSPHVVDFGLAKAIETDDGDHAALSTISLPGRVLGTLRYLSPEQALGDPAGIDARSDVYALGVMLYEALTDRMPFEETGDTSQFLRYVREGVARPLSSASRPIDIVLEAVVLKAIEVEKARRYGSVAELREDLERYLAGTPPRARPPSRLIRLRRSMLRHRTACRTCGGVVLLIAAGFAAHQLWQGYSERKQRAAARIDAVTYQHEIEAGRLTYAVGQTQTFYENHPDLPEALLVRLQARYRGGDEGQRDGVVYLLKGHWQAGTMHWTEAAFLSEIKEARGEAEEAALLRTQAEREMPDTADGWHLLSFTTLSTEKALRFVAEAVQRDSRHEPARQRALFLRVLLKDYQNALADVETLIHNGDGAVRWLLLRAQILLRLRRYEDVVAQCDSVSEPDSYSGALFETRATAQLCMENYKQALCDYSRSVELQKQTARWQEYYRATAYWLLGRTTETAAAYRAFRADNERHGYAAARLILVLLEQGREYRAAGAEAKAQACVAETNGLLAAEQTRTNPDPWVLQILDGIARGLKGEYQSDELSAAAMDANPARACEACYYAGEICLLAGHTREAIEWFQRCAALDLPLDPDSERPVPMNEYHLARGRLKQLQATVPP